MTILALIATLLGSQWSTTCVMTQSDNLQGYTIDTLTFQSDASNSKSLELSSTRIWFKDENCTEALGAKSTVKGSVTIGNSLESMTFPGAPSEDIFAADWKLGTQAMQMGSIGIANDGKSIRTATTSFGSTRNTMLSLFRYFAK